MKKLFYWVLVLFMFNTNLYAQTQLDFLSFNGKPLNSVEKYLKDNILSIDPIEGIYDVEYTTTQTSFLYNEPGKDMLSLRFAIVKEKNRGKIQFTAYFIGQSDILKETYLCPTFSGIGRTKVYNYSFNNDYFQPYKGRAELNNMDLIEFNFNISDLTKKKIFNNIGSAVKVNISYSLYKIFPTQDMLDAELTKKIEPDFWTGTGFALNDGYLVTNYHVIENAKSLLVRGIDGDFNIRYDACVIASDKSNDIALLKINDSKFNGFGSISYKIKSSLSDVGESIFVLGYPLTSTMGDEIKLTTGVLSSKTGYQGNVSQYQISAPVQPGSSGGPLFDNDGNVIGIISAKHTNAEGVGYAVKTSYLNNLVESVASASIIPNQNTLTTQSLPNKVKLVNNFIFIIECNAANRHNIDDHNVKSSAIEENEDKKEPDYNSDIIELNPIVRNQLNSTTSIVKVVITDQYTKVYIHAYPKEIDAWFNVDSTIHIFAENKKYKLIKAAGIEISPKRSYTSYSTQDIFPFLLYFESIPKTTKEFDMIESDESDWKWYGIRL